MHHRDKFRFLSVRKPVGECYNDGWGARAGRPPKESDP